MTRKIIIITGMFVFLLFAVGCQEVEKVEIENESKAEAIVDLLATEKLPLREGEAYDFDFEEYLEKPLTQMGEAQREEVVHTGKGFIVDEQGLIYTAAHIVEDADEIKATLSDGREFLAQVVEIKSDLDLAILQIAADGFQVLTIAQDNLQVGDEVQEGQILALKQKVELEGREFVGLIKTNIILDAGDSGSPLLSLDGEVLGLQIILGEGESYAAPLVLK